MTRIIIELEPIAMYSDSRADAMVPSMGNRIR